MTLDDILNELNSQLLPVSRDTLKRTVTLFNQFSYTEMFKDYVALSEGNLNVSIDLHEHMLLCELHLRLFSESLGIMFSDDINSHEMSLRIIALLDFELDLDDDFKVEDAYALELSLVMSTSLGHELYILDDISRYHELKMLTHEGIDIMGLDDTFATTYILFVKIAKHRVSESLRNAGNIQNKTLLGLYAGLDLDGFTSARELAEAILLITLLVEDTRYASMGERIVLLELVVNSAEGYYSNIRNTYAMVCEEYHS